MHIRFEHLGPGHPTPCEPFAAGLVLHHVRVSTSTVKSVRKKGAAKTSEDRKEVWAPSGHLVGIGGHLLIASFGETDLRTAGTS